MQASDFSIEPLTVQHAHAAFDCLCESFVNSSALHQWLDIPLDQYRHYLWPFFSSAIEQNLSLQALDPNTNTVLGVLLACDFCNQPASGSLSDCPGLAPLCALLRELRSHYRELLQRPAGELLLVDMAAVRPEATRRGIYQLLRRSAHKRAKAQGFTRVIGELSSPYSQRICIQRFGHRELASVSMQQFRYNAEHPFAGLTATERTIAVVGDL